MEFVFKLVPLILAITILLATALVILIGAIRISPPFQLSRSELQAVRSILLTRLAELEKSQTTNRSNLQRKLSKTKALNYSVKQALRQF
jgi:hypothetical protein